MRMPDLDHITSKVKIQSPLVGSITSNDSDPIDISRSSASADTSFPVGSLSFNSTTSQYLQQRSSTLRSHAGSYAASHNRRQSLSRSVGSFVGSYEESILSGRMSQTPSRPLDFTASIGVLGRGRCKASLRCPPHLTVAFPAYFYSESSPYVGQIDVEQQRDGQSASNRGYRIPAEGQLQIIIKNPNKTAVKVFLIPYNVSDMPPLSKTFFRQKHYDMLDGDKLRYAIHVQISCPAQDRYYIHKTQRVVFANRVPDGQESLKITMQSPQPAYTPWVPEKRQRKADQHARPDSREPNFIGGSLLDRDHDVSEEVYGVDGMQHTDGPLRDGQSTPRPGVQGLRSPFSQLRKTSYLKATSTLRSDESVIQDNMPRSGHSTSGNAGGLLGERLKALALAREVQEEE